MSHLDSEDDFPNDFDGLDFSTIPGLQQPPADEPPHTVSESPLVSASLASTGSYDLSEEGDLSFFAALDAIEARALRGTTPGNPSRPSSEDKKSEHMPENSIDQTRKRFIELSEELAFSKKGKMKAEVQEDVQAILEGYEDEMSCPICCDILVAAHMASPCGHTCCGQCGYGWLSRNKYSPTCAVCRAKLTAGTPLLPNFVVDCIVRQHIQALAKSGRPDWQENGYRLIEWSRRLEAWKRESAARTAAEKAKEARQRRHQSRYNYNFGDYDGAVYVHRITEDDRHPGLAPPRRRSRAHR